MNEMIEMYQRMSLVINILSISLTVFSLVCMWRVFSKAGEGGWKILIPFYNVYIQFKIANARKRFWICFLLTLMIPLILGYFARGFIYYVQLYGSLPRIDNDTAIGILISVVIMLVIFILNVSINFSMAKAFGLPGIFGLGLWLLPWIFYAIIAFSGSIQYASRRRRSRYLED